MMYRRLRLVLIGISICLCAKPQVDQKLENLRNVVPPSPNSSSLGKYGDWPVSLYTGLPDISIPIYELKGRSVSVPVTISYHPSGIRVGEMASQVGLGWSLNAGGVISRSVRGLPDEEGYFSASPYYANPDNFCSTSYPSSFSTQHKVAAAKGDMDSQQDIYHLNALGKSLRLLIKSDGTVLTMPYSNIKITTSAQNGQKLWTVIWEDGTKLLFGGSNNFVETNYSPQFLNPFVSSWYLFSVISVSGETINLTYTLSGQLYEDAYYSEHDVIKYSLAMNGSIIHGDKSRNFPRQYITPYNLSSIESASTRIDFISSPANRQDVKNGSCLSEIKVYSKPGSSLIEDYVFTYGYSSCAESNETVSGIALSDTGYLHKRLKLLALERKSVSGNLTAQKWNFEYDPRRLPSRRSYAQDHWGFYNGAVNNTTFLPKVYYSLPLTYAGSGLAITGFMPSYHEWGAQKDPDESNMQAESLTKIIYPEGGYTQFEYEGNGYPATKEFFGDQTISQNLTLTGSSNPYVPYKDYPFNITAPEYISLSLSSFISPSILNDFPGAKCDGQILNSADQVVCGIANNGFQWFNLAAAGNYKLRIKTNVTQNEIGNGTVIIDAQFRYFPSLGNQSYKKLVGGLRVKSITDFDGIMTNGVNKKYFVYENPLEINPLNEQTDYLTEQDEDVCPGSGGGTPTNWHKVTRNVSTKYSLGAIRGGTVGYGKVTTMYGLNGINGKSVSIFNNEEDQGVPSSKVFPYPPPETREWRRGVLLQQTEYNAANVKLKEEINTYGFVYKYGVTNFSSGYSKIWCPDWCTDPLQYCGIAFACYNISTEQVKQLGRTETTWQPDGSNPLTTVTSYFYDNPNNLSPTRTETNDSKGNIVKTISRTPLEKTDINAITPLTATAAAAIDTMLARNIISPVLQQEQYRANIFQSRSLTNYKNWSSEKIQPENIQLQLKNNPVMETRVQFTKYDVSGNLLEQKKANDIIHSYIWDYENNYPVAECTGADSANTAYTSFESGGKGYWAFSGTTSADASAPTGHKVYSLNGSNTITKTGVSSSTVYIISYWTKNIAAFAIAGTMSGYPMQGRTINGWRYFEHKITGQTQVSIGGNGFIDELRLYPDKTVMTTCTYDPLIGMTSRCDANNRINYYEYDVFNRLVLIRDQDQYIVRKICYNYAGQPENCTSACASTFPNWQNTSTPPGCQQNACGNTGYQLQEQQDINPCSPTYNQTQWIVAGYNPAACPPSANVTITYQNGVNISGFTALYTNMATSQAYSYNIPGSGSGTLCCNLPPGTYTLSVSKPGNMFVTFFDIGCRSTSGTSAYFIKVPVSSTTCNYINLGIAE